MTLQSNFKIPLYRDILLALGICSVSMKSCANILKQGWFPRFSLQQMIDRMLARRSRIRSHDCRRRSRRIALSSTGNERSHPETEIGILEAGDALGIRSGACILFRGE